MSTRSRSRRAWPAPISSEVIDEQGTAHRLEVLEKRQRKSLTLIVFLLLAVFTLSYFVWTQEQYILGKGEQRDRENAEMEERIREGICKLLDGFPSTPLLDLRRAEFGCGPGLPVDAFPPEVQQELNGRNQPRTAPPSESAQAATPPPVGTPAVPNPPRAVEAPPPPREGPGAASEPEQPEPAPEPDPLLDLEPATDPLCDALAICL